MKREKCMFKKFSNVKISAIASASGKEQHDVAEICSSFLDERHVKRLIKTLGFEKIRQIPLNMTTADMCVQLSNDLLEELKVSKSSIDALIFVTQTNDSIAPASVFSMQNKIGLSSDCYLNNIINGCAGSMHGLLEGVSLISAGMASKVLVCFGDTYCKLHELADADQKANVALFGDGAGAILLEKDTTAPDIFINYEAHGQFNQAIHDSKYSERLERLKIGVNEGTLEPSVLENYTQSGLHIDGTAIASYAIDYVVPNLLHLLEESGKSILDIPVFMLHQANKTVLKSVALTLGIDPGKIPFTADQTGNTSSAALALAISESDYVRQQITRGHTVLSAFGVGMNVISVLADLSKTRILTTRYF